MTEKLRINESGDYAELIINRPEKLNVLDKEIVLEGVQILKELEKSKKEILILGEGSRAFCAGGDVVAVTTGGAEAAEFFEKEYEFDLAIHHSKVPITVLGDGIVMGGGLGILAGGNTRIVTDKSMLAMPEITIGLFPDVGATHWLNKVPGKWNYFLGLTGFRFNGAEAVELGIADLEIPADQRESFREAFLAGKGKSFLDSVKIQGNSEIEKLNPYIEELFMDGSLEGFDERCRISDAPERIQKAIATYQAGSPLSAAIIYHQLSNGREMGLEDAFAQDVRLCKKLLVDGDFREGVRSLLVDKDKEPKWKFKSAADVPSNEVLKYFF